MVNLANSEAPSFMATGDSAHLVRRPLCQCRDCVCRDEWQLGVWGDDDSLEREVI